MFIVFLKFSENKARATDYMTDHNAWLKKGFDDGVFFLAGSIDSGLGGSVLAHNVTREQLVERVNADPFVSEKVVSSEIIGISPKKADDRLKFLLSD